MTERQKKFVAEYLISGNASKAARNSGYASGNANRQGYKLLQNHEVRAAIDSQIEKLANERIAEAQEVLEYLTSVMRGETLEIIVVPSGKKIEVPPRCSKRLRAAEILLKVYGAFREERGEERNPAEVLRQALLSIEDQIPDDGKKATA